MDLHVANTRHFARLASLRQTSVTSTCHSAKVSLRQVPYSIVLPPHQPVDLFALETSKTMKTSYLYV